MDNPELVWLFFPSWDSRGGSMQDVYALTPAILLLLVGLLAMMLMRPLRLSPIVGYLTFPRI